MKYRWRTIGFVPDTSWDAIYALEDGSEYSEPICGWIIEEECAVHDDGFTYWHVERGEIRDRRVVAAVFTSAEVEPCTDTANFKELRFRNSSEKRSAMAGQGQQDVIN